MSTFVFVCKRYVAHEPLVYIAFITLTHLFAHFIYTINMCTLIIKIIVYTSTRTFLHTTNSLKIINVFCMSAVSDVCYFKTVQMLFILWDQENIDTISYIKHVLRWACRNCVYIVNIHTGILKVRYHKIFRLLKNT